MRAMILCPSSPQARASRVGEKAQTPTSNEKESLEILLAMHRGLHQIGLAVMPYGS